MGKLIVIDGLDGCGKQTQSIKLTDRLITEGYNCKRISFPNYDSYSSILVKAYLNGKLGNNISSISRYAICSFYACDRYISYINEWKDFYEQDDSIIIADRYVQSNMLYSSLNIEENSEIFKFCDWVLEYEHKLIGVPVADKVIFLSLDPSVSYKLIKNRNDNKHGSSDIHEDQFDMMYSLYDKHKLIGNHYDWNIIDCNDKNNGIRDIESIYNDIYLNVINDLNK